MRPAGLLTFNELLLLLGCDCHCMCWFSLMMKLRYLPSYLCCTPSFPPPTPRTAAAKGMLADLKEAADKRRLERSAVLQAVSGRADFAARLQPHLTFEAGRDVEACKDACTIIQLGINSNLSAEHAPKVGRGGGGGRGGEGESLWGVPRNRSLSGVPGLLGCSGPARNCTHSPCQPSCLVTLLTPLVNPPTF